MTFRDRKVSSCAYYSNAAAVPERGAMSTHKIVRVALLAAAAAALIAAAVELREKRLLTEQTVDEIEDQLTALDPATRAAVVARLASDAANEAKQRLNP
jgi:hypothetical protein